MEPLDGIKHLQKLKNRIINFRVTDDELARLKSASDLHGARCLSDFARTIMLREQNPVRPGRRRAHQEQIRSLSAVSHRWNPIFHGLVINMLACLREVCHNHRIKGELMRLLLTTLVIVGGGLANSSNWNLLARYPHRRSALISQPSRSARMISSP